MKNQFGFNKLKLGIKNLDKGFNFAKIIMVNPTALSVRRDGGFYYYAKKILCFY